jgi:hypothetical protein
MDKPLVSFAGESERIDIHDDRPPTGPVLVV